MIIEQKFRLPNQNKRKQNISSLLNKKIYVKSYLGMENLSRACLINTDVFAFSKLFWSVAGSFRYQKQAADKVIIR